MSGDVDKGCDDQTIDRQVPIVVLFASAKPDLLGLRGGDVQRTEHPVPLEGDVRGGFHIDPCHRTGQVRQVLVVLGDDLLGAEAAVVDLSLIHI